MSLKPTFPNTNSHGCRSNIDFACHLMPGKHRWIRLSRPTSLKEGYTRCCLRCQEYQIGEYKPELNTRSRWTRIYFCCAECTQTRCFSCKERPEQPTSALHVCSPQLAATESRLRLEQLEKEEEAGERYWDMQKGRWEQHLRMGGKGKTTTKAKRTRLDGEGRP